MPRDVCQIGEIAGIVQCTTIAALITDLMNELPNHHDLCRQPTYSDNIYM